MDQQKNDPVSSSASLFPDWTLHYSVAFSSQQVQGRDSMFAVTGGDRKYLILLQKKGH
jgi:hypothetical protein